MKYARLPLSRRNVEGLLFERGIDICHEAMKWPSRSTASDITCEVRLTMRVSQLVAALSGAKSAFRAHQSAGSSMTLHWLVGVRSASNAAGN